MPLSRAAENYKKKLGRDRFPFMSVSSASLDEMEEKGVPSIFDRDEQQSQQPKGRTPYVPEKLEFNQPMPVRDTETEDQIKRRTKQQVFGQFLGSLGQLGGMAAGGDAVRLDNKMLPIDYERLMELDKDYRDRLLGYMNNIFNTDKYNNQLQNKALEMGAEQDFRTGEREAGQDFTVGRDEARFKNQEERDEAQFGQRNKEMSTRNWQDIAKEMRSLGEDPNDPEAMKKYLAKRDKQFNANVERTNRLGTGGGGKGWNEKINDPDFLQKARAGRDLRLKQIEQEIQKYSNPIQRGEDGGLDISATTSRQAILKRLDEERKAILALKIVPENQRAIDMYDLYESERGDGNTFVPQPGGGQQQPGGNLQQQFNSIMNEIVRGNMNNLPTAVEILLNSGEAKDEEEAIEIIRYIRSQNK